MRKQSGFTYVELLMATLVVAIAAVSALATWQISSRAPANKRATEMGVFVATQELERMKAIKVDGLAAGSTTVRYYDRYGAPAAAAATNGFRTTSYVTAIVDRNGTPSTDDLYEIRVEVHNNDGSKLLEEARTLLTLGGV